MFSLCSDSGKTISDGLFTAPLVDQQWPALPREYSTAGIRWVQAVEKGPLVVGYRRPIVSMADKFSALISDVRCRPIADISATRG